MSPRTTGSLTRRPRRKPPATDQRVLVHNVPPSSYQALCRVLDRHPGLRMKYDDGNLEIRTTTAPPAPHLWTSDTQRLLLEDITWDEYETILEALDGHHLRMTYDSGSLEIMTLSPEHERYKGLLHWLVGVLCEELEIDIEGLGSTTFKRHIKEKGLEPDECFYVANAKRARGIKRVDLNRYPPPDLALEVDITHIALDRMKIYAGLGVPEVWQFDGRNVRVWLLDPEGKYRESDHSPTFPMVSLAKLSEFVRLGVAKGPTVMARRFRAWLGKLINKQGE